MQKILIILILIKFIGSSIEHELKSDYPFNDNFCGIMSQSAGLIYGGEYSVRNQFPWSATISVFDEDEWSHKGSGSLISHKHILTTARCVSYTDSFGNLISIDVSRVMVYLGTTKYDDLNEKGSLKVGVNAISNHPFAREALSSLDVNKISIITLDQDILFTEFLRPVCLWPFNTDLSDIIGRDAYTVGYGQDESGNNTLTRKHARVTIQENCDGHFENELQFQNETRLFCAKGNGEDAPCTYDTQLYMKIGPNWFIKGIVSTIYTNDDGICDPEKPALYEDIEPNFIAIKWLIS